MVAEKFDNMLWAYKATFKQTNAGGGNIVVNITMFDRSILEYGMIGPNDYAANRTVLIQILDVDGDVLSTILNSATVDNSKYAFPVDDHSVVAATDGNKFQMRVIMGITDKIVINALSLVQNEELTINLRMRIGPRRPVVTTTGSTGTVTITLGYNKVI